ncbi:MAG TPA: histidine kinase [Nocardioidaceae bacterium]|nr:histidine kinase [Nocardioidaceae bacterium]
MDELAAGPPTPWWSALADWAPVVAVAALSQTGIGLENPWTGSGLELALTGLATALPLGWRRTRPVAMGTIVAAALCVQVLVVGGSLHFGSFCAALISMYSVARYTAHRWRAVGGGVLLAVGVVVAASASLSSAPSDVAFPIFYFTGTWLLGRGMRTLTHRADHLQRLNESLAREREQEARLAVATERLRIARDLHDVVAHTVMLMVVQAEAAAETLGSDPVATGQALSAVQEAGRHGMDDLRDLVGVLRDGNETGPATPPGLADLDALRRRMQESGLEVELHREGDLGALPGPLGWCAYRVVQEALTNVLKHSHAARVQVRVVADEQCLQVAVHDPGPARAGARAASHGHGLAGMAERLGTHDGVLRAGPLAGGFRVTAEVPLAGVRR